MNHRAVALATLALAFAASFTASAGARRVIEVTVDDARRQAFGAIGAANSSADAMQYIRCYSDTSGTGSCTARNAQGLVRSCVTNNPDLVRMIRALRSDSYLIFNWNTAGQCSSMVLTLSSRDPPKSR